MQAIIAIKVELEVRRFDVVYKRRQYVIEERWSDGSGGMFIYKGSRLICSTWDQEGNTSEGLEVEEAYLTDPTHWS